MCCCKLHLHIWWVIGTTIKSAENENIVLPFKNYAEFLNHLTQHCKPGSIMHLDWSHTPSKKENYRDIDKT